MKIMAKFGNGPVRSLNKVIVGVFVIALLAVFAYCTVEGIDAEMHHNDLVVESFLNRGK